MLRIITTLLVGIMCGIFIASKVKAQVGERMSTSATLSCDTAEALKDIMAAQAEGGTEAGQDRFRLYAAMLNDKGEGICVLTPLHNVFVLAKLDTYKEMEFGDKVFDVTVLRVAYDEATVFYTIILTKVEAQNS